uniref:Uncharacterized protein n=1 Tax=Anser brachyrhynchus TaxID=132585 RepID=A0A8B9BZ38_9AVES
MKISILVQYREANYILPVTDCQGSILVFCSLSLFLCKLRRNRGGYISHMCSPAAMIPIPDSFICPTWHMDLSPMIYFLLERMGCQKEDRCFLSGSMLGRKQISKKLQHFTMVLFFSIL